ncbi:hypothetical protein ACFX1R_012359 [Malus domestica]
MNTLLAQSCVHCMNVKTVPNYPKRMKLKDVTEKFLNRLRDGLNCNCNGGVSAICHFFARKFQRSTLEQLLRIATQSFGFNN